ncbi:MAG TPA: FtsX-like permease family protein [Mycobacteriales bacterium]|nr:FtsX-like permease family protein [Mycobacteriales bacterium]
MIAIAFRTLRARWVGFAGAFLACMLAVTLVGGWAILLESGSRAKVAPQRLTGAPVVVSGKQDLKLHYGNGDDESVLLPERVRLDPALVGKIRNINGVRSATADISFDAHTGSGDVTGHNWTSATLTPYTLISGSAPATDDQIVVQHGTVGDHIGLNTAIGSRDYTISGVVAPQRRVDGAPAVFLKDSEADRVSGYGGKIDAIGVIPESGITAGALASRLERAVPGADVLTGADRGRVEFPDTVQSNSDLVAISGAVGGVAIMVAIFVVASTLSVSIQQRYREIALLRAIAATPGQVRRMVQAETLLLSLVAVAAGIGPAIAFAEIISRAFVGRGILPHGFHVYIGWIAPLVAAASTVVVGQAAAFIAGRRAAKVHPTVALAESAVQPHRLGFFRLLLGLAALTGGILLLTVSMSATGDNAAGAAAGMIMVFMVAVGLLGPIFSRIGAVLLGIPIRSISRIGGFLAAVHARSRSRRLASAMTPVALCVSLSFITLVLQATISHAQADQDRKGVVADRVVQAAGPGIPAGVVHDLAGVSGVDSAVGYVQTQAESGRNLSPYPAGAVTGGRIDRVLDLDVRQGSLAGLTGGSVALSEQGASAFHGKLGQRIEVRLGDGTLIRPRVVAIYSRGLGFGDLMFPWSTVSAHLSTPALSVAYVRFSSGANPEQAIRAAYPGLIVGDRTSYEAQLNRDQKMNAWVNNVMLGTIVGFVAIAVANTLVMTMLERRREFALLRLVGATTTQVMRMVRWEAVLILVLGLGIGIAIGWTTMIPFCRALGEGVSTYVPPVPALALAGGAILLAVLSSVLPTRRALQQPPIEAIGLRD